MGVLGDRPRSDSAACGVSVRRPSIAGQAQSFDRRVGDSEAATPSPPLPCPAEPEQRLGLAPQVSFVTRAADLDVSDACIPAAIGEPGAAERTISQDIGLNRSCGRSFRGRQRRVRASATGGRIASGNVGATRFQPPVFLFSCLPARSSSSDRDRATEVLHQVKTSPLAELCGSHQPCPSWLTIRISPARRRYFRARRVLSRRSDRLAAGQRTSSATQLNS